MTTNNDDSEDFPGLKSALDEIHECSAQYDNRHKAIIAAPLFINAGAVIALVGFFTNTCHGVSCYIISAAGFFILGALCGMFALVFEYLASYFEMKILRKHLYEPKLSKERYILELIERHEKYYPGLLIRRYDTLKLRMINGAISILFCFFGIFFIAQFLFNNFFVVLLAAIIAIIYFLYMFNKMYVLLSPKI